MYIEGALMSISHNTAVIKIFIVCKNGRDICELIKIIRLNVYSLYKVVHQVLSVCSRLLRSHMKRAISVKASYGYSFMSTQLTSDIPMLPLETHPNGNKVVKSKRKQSTKDTP